ncbi:unnamed protein product [Toxocara canis]|uniref:BHLH domain-containing protein n=1 Tax=Toxocara canis TaxID=6265 RepID=A0A183VD10_TOXCA|nr:unnamed protein product [Toxocara canis]
MSKFRSDFAQNNRERRRQLHVNEAFNQLTNVRNLAQHRSMVSFIDAMNCPDPLKQALLRQIIPCYPINKKMSKQEILRGAIHYIRILEYLLGMRPTFA